MIFSRLIKKAVMVAGATCLSVAGLSGVALADYASTGEIASGIVTQIVIQNDSDEDEDKSYKWMNSETCEEVYYQATQSISLVADEGAFDLIGENLKMASIYFAYYGKCQGECQFDFALTNVYVYSDGFEPVRIADYNSIELGTNRPSKGQSYNIIYDFKDQIDPAVRTEFLKNIRHIDFDITVAYLNFTDAVQKEATGQIIDARRPAAPVDENGVPMELQSYVLPGQSAEIAVQFFGMDGEVWAWKDTTTDIDMIYGEKNHYETEIDGATLFSNLVPGTPMQTVGLQLVKENVNADDAGYYMDYSLNNIKLRFKDDTYKTLVIPNFNNVASGNSNKYYTQYDFINYFPEGADIADMLLNLKSIEFDADIRTLGVYVPAGSAVEPTAPVETTPEEEETTVKTEETTAKTEETTVKTEETTASEETTIAEESSATSTTAEETKTGEKEEGKSSVKTIVTIVAIVLMLAALVAVAIMYVKKSKM